MTDKDPTHQRTDTNPAHQTGEEKGTIKQPRQTDRNMPERDLPRGSEAETHARR